MEFELAMKMVIALGSAVLAKTVADWLKNWSIRWSRKNQSTEFEIQTPTGNKLKISVSAGQNLDPSVVKRGILEGMLKDPKYRFREFNTLKSAIASGDDETKTLLLQIGARHNIKPGGADTWTLLEL